MRHIFIINPAAGKGKHVAELTERIRFACTARAVDFLIYTTTRVGDATEAVQRMCADADTDTPLRFYACGGDGTLGEVTSGMADCPHAQLALIPAGTGNDFVRNFTENQNFFDINAQLDGTPAPIDALRLDDRWCINMINIGFDCEVVCKKEDLNKKPYIPSKLAYIAGVALTFFKMPGIRARVSVDGAPYETMPLQLTTMANGTCCGGGFRSNPRASLQDGSIDLLQINPVSRLAFLRLIGSYQKGTHLDGDKNAKILRTLKCRTIDMEFDCDQNICIDGEVTQTRKLHIKAAPAAVQFSIPRGSALCRPYPIKTPTEVPV